MNRRTNSLMNVSVLSWVLRVCSEVIAVGAPCSTRRGAEARCVRVCPSNIPYFLLIHQHTRHLPTLLPTRLKSYSATRHPTLTLCTLKPRAATEGRRKRLERPRYRSDSHPLLRELQQSFVTSRSTDAPPTDGPRAAHRAARAPSPSHRGAQRRRRPRRPCPADAAPPPRPRRRAAAA